MKEAHINELSLAGQFESFTAFRQVFDPIVSFRSENPRASSRFFCSRTLSSSLVTPDLTLQRGVLSTRDHDYIGLVLNWLAKSGPFWDDNRYSNVDDLFYFEQTDVTDMGLGEAARRRLVGIDAGTFSFIGGGGIFSQTPLAVIHGLLEQPIETIDVPNTWEISTLSLLFQFVPETWEEAIQQWLQSYAELIFASNLSEYLRRIPFDIRLAESIAEILQTLNTLAAETQADGSFTAAGMALWQLNTVGARVRITDESDENKNRFKQDLTFRDPQERSRELFCPWHGKIKLNQFRIHFEWPRPVGRRSIKIVFVGPKITKK